MSPRIIEFIGGPASGKSSLAERLQDRLSTAGADCVLLNSESLGTDCSRPYRRIFDWVRASLVLRRAIVRRVLSSGDVPDDVIRTESWQGWVRRLRKEWLNCAACRRYVARRCRDRDAVICDSRLLGKFLYEGADPRNAVGATIVDVLCSLAVGLPLPVIDLVIVVKAPARVAAMRADTRERNRIRPDLDHDQRQAFFEGVESLSCDIEARIRTAGLARDSLCVDGSDGAMETSMSKLSEVLRMPKEQS